jgi:hypothetical protein
MSNILLLSSIHFLSFSPTTYTDHDDLHDFLKIPREQGVQF